MSTPSCEYCLYYEYDELTDSYECSIEIDQDEQERYMSGYMRSCPYYRAGDEYTIVRKQN